MKSELKQAMRPFRVRLAAEAVIHAACISGAFVLPVWLVMALAQRVLHMGWNPAWMAAAWLLMFAALYIFRYRPAGKKAARRMDALCGLDRIATAMEFEKSGGVLCRMQREDAAKRLAAIKPEALRIALPIPALVWCLLLTAAIAAVPHVPQDMIDAARDYAAVIPGLQHQESEETAALRGIIGEMRSEVESSGIKDADKAALLARLDEIQSKLNGGYIDISVLQEIRDAMEGMQETVKELTPRDTYMAAMIEFESLRLLGEAIYDQNMDVVVMILDSFGRQLHEKKDMEQVDALMRLAYDVNSSLAKPLRDNGQEQLRQGMMAFAAGLETAAQMVYNGRDNTKIIDMALDTIEVYIRDYLGVPEEGERYDPYANKVYEPSAQSGNGNLPSAAVQTEKPLSRMETEYVYDLPKALKASSYVPGALDEQGKQQRLKAEQREKATGTVPYGEVYGAYYADYLGMLSDETFPQELRDVAEAYMNGL